MSKTFSLWNKDPLSENLVNSWLKAQEKCPCHLQKVPERFQELLLPGSPPGVPVFPNSLLWRRSRF